MKRKWQDPRIHELGPKGQDHILTEAKKSIFWQDVDETLLESCHMDIPNANHSSLLTRLWSRFSTSSHIANRSPQRMSGGLFGHIPLVKDQLGKKPERGIHDILEQTDGSYRWIVNQIDYDALPKAEKWKLISIFGLRALLCTITEAAIRLAPNTPCHDLSTFDAPHTIGPLFESDEAFWLQRFQGTNPAHIMKKQDNTYQLDYKHLLVYNHPGPTCLFDSHGKPIQIDLNNGLVITPSSSWKWMYAKLVVSCAEFTQHELINHLGQCHLVMEVCIMATMQVWREKKQNPIFRLLLPHFSRTLAVNQGARQLLLPWIKDHLTMLDDTMFHQLLQDTVQKFDCRLLNIEYQLTTRGFNLNNIEPDYYYAQDAIALWFSLLSFVKNILSLDTMEWQEVSQWCLLIQNHIPSFPTIDDMDTLAKMITGFIFNASFQHAAVNDPQYYFFGFVPNAIPKLMLPVLTEPLQNESEWESYVMRSLPSVEVMYLQRDLVSLLALGPPNNSSFLEAIQEYPFDTKEFITKLTQISTNIQARNIYTWLDPLQATRSVIR